MGQFDSCNASFYICIYKKVFVENIDVNNTTQYILLSDVNGDDTILEKIYAHPFGINEKTHIMKFFAFLSRLDDINIYQKAHAKTFIDKYNAFVKGLDGTSEVFQVLHMNTITCMDENNKHWNCEDFFEFINYFQSKLNLRIGIIDGLHRFYGLSSSLLLLNNLSVNDSKTVPEIPFSSNFHTKKMNYYFCFLRTEDISNKNFHVSNIYKDWSHQKMIHNSNTITTTDLDIMLSAFEKIHDKNGIRKGLLDYMNHFVDELEGDTHFSHRLPYLKFHHKLVCDIYNYFVDKYKERGVLSKFLQDDYNFAKEQYQTFLGKKETITKSNVFVHVPNEKIITNNTQNEDDLLKVSNIYMKKVMDSLGQMLYYDIMPPNRTYLRKNACPHNWTFLVREVIRNHFIGAPTTKNHERERIFNRVTYGIITHMVFCQMYPAIYDTFGNMIKTSFWEKFMTVSEDEQVIHFNKGNINNIEKNIISKQCQYICDGKVRNLESMQLRPILYIHGILGTLFKCVIFPRLDKAIMVEPENGNGRPTKDGIQQSFYRNHVADALFMFLEAYALLGDHPYHFIYNCKNECLRQFVKRLCDSSNVIDSSKFVARETSIYYTNETKALEELNDEIDNHLEDISREHTIFEALLLMYVMLAQHAFDDKEITDQIFSFGDGKNTLYTQDDKKKWKSRPAKFYKDQVFSHHNDNTTPQPFLSKLLPFKSFLNYIMTDNIDTLTRDVPYEHLKTKIQDVKQNMIFHEYLLGTKNVRKSMDDALQVTYFQNDRKMTVNVKRTKQKKTKGLTSNANDNVPSAKSGIQHSTTDEEIKNSATALGAKVERYDTPLYRMMSSYMKIFTKSPHTKEELEETVAIHYHIDTIIENSDKIVNKFRNLEKDEKKKVITEFLRHHEMETKINCDNVTEIIDITGVESEDSEGEFKQEDWTDDSQDDSDFVSDDKEEGYDDDNEKDNDKESDTENVNKIEEKKDINKEKNFQNVDSVDVLGEALGIRNKNKTQKGKKRKLQNTNISTKEAIKQNKKDDKKKDSQISDTGKKRIQPPRARTGKNKKYDK